MERQRVGLVNGVHMSKQVSRVVKLGSGKEFISLVQCLSGTVFPNDFTHFFLFFTNWPYNPVYHLTLYTRYNWIYNPINYFHSTLLGTN